MRCTSNEPAAQITRFGFYVAAMLFFYGTLFPFQFDFSARSLSHALSHAGLIPYWDAARGRVPSMPDMLSNFLLTLPVGFFGLLFFGRQTKAARIAQWGAVGLIFGLVAELLQLGIPSRTADITDALNNGLGALAGAGAAFLIGRQVLELLSGVLLDREKTYLLLSVVVVTAAMFAPFDVSLNVSHFRSVAKAILADPWQGRVPIEDNWVVMVEFAVVGALAGRVIRSDDIPFRLSRNAAIMAVLTLPLVFEPAQLLVESHSPGLRDLSLELLGTCAGLISGMQFPTLSRPLCGLVLMTAALLAAGLSPYRFTGWHARASFEWIPLIEYYSKTTASALADAMTGFLHFALLGGLLKLSFRFRRHLVILLGVALAVVIEFTQTLIPTRYAGVTDIVIAALGAWTGDTICGAIEGHTHRN